MHNSYEVVISTDRVEFVVYQFGDILGANKVRANELKDAIAEVISEARG